MVRSGHLVRFLPGVFGVASADPVRAAGLYVDGRGGLSHTTALAIWGLRPPAPAPIHLTVVPRCRLRAPGLDVHVRDSLVLGPPDVVRRDGLPVTALDDTIVASWPLLPVGDRTAAAVRAVNDRLTTPSRLAAAIHRSHRVADRGDLVRLVGKLASGCRSYLEVFGLDHVFHGLDFERQAPIEADAALATRGILVVRFSYRRLVGDPAGVRQEVITILDARR